MVKGNKLACDHCGADLLNPAPHGIYSLVRGEKSETKIRRVYACCKNECDRALQKQYGWGGWQDLEDLTVPTIWLRRWMAVVNGIALNGEKYEPEAYERLRSIFVAIFPYISRELNDWDQQRIEVHFQTEGM